VVAVCDTEPRLLSTAAARFGEAVQTATDLTDLLHAELDGVFVLTPDDSHERIAIELLDAGVNVFLESRWQSPSPVVTGS
jgi:predicted dehydrogenase